MIESNCDVKAEAISDEDCASPAVPGCADNDRQRTV